MSCDLCDSSPSGLAKQLNEKQAQAEKYVQQENKEVIIYRTSTGYEFATVEYFYAEHPGQFIGFVLPKH